MSYLDAVSVDERREIEKKIVEVQRVLNDIGNTYGLGVSVSIYAMPASDDYACVFLHLGDDLIMSLDNIGDIDGCLDNDEKWSNINRDEQTDE